MTISILHIWQMVSVVLVIWQIIILVFSWHTYDWEDTVIRYDCRWCLS
jgi:hypothetical protein